MGEDPPDQPSHASADAPPCPFCRSPAVVRGKLVGRAVGFAPDGLKPFAWTFTPPDVPVGPPASICSDCGAVWSHADPATFRRRYERWRTGGSG